MEKSLTRTLLLAAGLCTLAPVGFGKSGPLPPAAPRPAALPAFRPALNPPATGRLLAPLSAARPLVVFGPVSEEWVARYSFGYSVKVTANATAKDVAVDAAGNVYVAGTEIVTGQGINNKDYILLKYSPSGQRLWLARYNGALLGDDVVQALAVDAAGNAYLTGSSAVGSFTDNNTTDYATVKFSPDGYQQWSARYNGPASGNDVARDVAVDAAGNVYVTGTSAGAGSQSDYATIKYSPSGQQLWVSRYNGPANSADEAAALAVDAAGNVYVTGYTDYGKISGPDYATVKYSPDGQQQWVARYNGPADGYDEATALGVDAAGNVYVTGYSSGGSSGPDYATVKYSSGGQQLWEARYNGPANNYDQATALAVTAAGEVYVTGFSVGSSSATDYATLKYSTSGQQLWAARYNGTSNGADEALDLALDAAGNAYVTGRSQGPPGFASPDYATLKYAAASGQQLWEARYNGPPANGYDEATALAVDAANNVYVTGNSSGTFPDASGFGIATVKYAQAAGGAAPTLTLPGPIFAGTAALPNGGCGTFVNFMTATASGDPAPTITYAVAGTPITSAYVFPTGVTTVTVTPTNSVGTKTGTFAVTVADRTAPTVRAKPITVQLDGSGQATITAADVDDGSTDACGIAERTVSPSTFTCANLGPNGVTLTVRDAAGNPNSVSTIVTVEGGSPTTAAITVVPANDVYTGGVPTNLYLGYGPQRVTLQAPAGGSSYSWSGPAGLSDATSAAPVFTATAPGRFTYTVSIANAGGCPSTGSVTLVVQDVSCGNKKKDNKVIVCHNGKEQCVSASAVDSHLRNHEADQLGSCAAGGQKQVALLASSGSTRSGQAEELAPALEAYPNPFSARTTLRFRAAQAGPAQLRVYNSLGQVVATLFDGPASAGQAVQVELAGENLPQGLYTCRLLLGGKVSTQRVLLTK